MLNPLTVGVVAISATTCTLFRHASVPFIGSEAVAKKLTQPKLTNDLRWRLLLTFINLPNPEEDTTTLSIANITPGKCEKCKGKGKYRWNDSKSGMPMAGMCYSCKGTGKQTKEQIIKNQHYNHHESTRRITPLRATLDVDAKRVLHMQKMGSKIIIDIMERGK
jgi:hypothetical protein